MKNLDEMMKAAQSLQNKLGEAQAALDRIEVEGQAGAGLVKVRATAKGKILRVMIDPSLLSPDDKDMLEDLVAAAINDTRVKAEATAAEQMSKVTAGLPLPPGFKMPF
jgi:nucleoid-associated protein EbfC